MDIERRDGTTPQRGTTPRRGTTINLRIEAETRDLIDSAAIALGKTRTEFMIETARRQAVDVLLDQRLFRLSDDHHAAFVAVLDAPPASGPKLKSLMQRRPLWDR